MKARGDTHLSAALGLVLLAAAGGARAGEERTTLAVIGFRVEAGDVESACASETLRSLLEAGLSAEGWLALVERRRIDEILGELSLSRSGLFSDEDALRIGRLVKARFLVYGSMGRREGKRFLRARMVEARTGKIRRSYSRELGPGSEPDAAEELARAIVLTARRDRPGPRLAILPFRQTFGFDRLLHLQAGLRDLLVGDFEELGTFFVLEREDMRALAEELELAQSGLTPGGAGPDYEREAWYLLSGDYEDVTIDGEAGVKLQVFLMSVGRGGERKLTIEHPVSALDELRRGVVRWVSKEASARRPYRYDDRYAEFNWLLNRAASFLSCIRGVSLPRMPGIKVPQERSGWSSPVKVSRSDGPACDALVEAARNTLECAAFIRPGDPRTKALLRLCGESRRRPQVKRRGPEPPPTAPRAEAGLKARMQERRASTGRLRVVRYSLPNEYAHVEQMRIDGHHAWLVCGRDGPRKSTGPPAGSCIQRLNVRTGQVTKFLGPGRRPTSVALAPDCVWVGTYGLGLWRMDRAAGAWRRYSEESGLPFDYVTALDWREGRLYVGFGRGERGGMARMDERDRFTLLRDDERADAWRSPGMMRGRCGWYVWDRRWERPEGRVFKVRATPQGFLARVNGQKWLVFYNEKHGAWGCLGFSTMQGGVGMDSHSGLIWCRGEHWKEKVEVYEFYEPAPGGKWRQAGTFRTGNDPRIPMPKSAARSAGKIWFVADSVGNPRSSRLYSYDPESLEVRVYGPQDGLDSERAYAVVAGEEGVWVGASTGLYRVEPSGEAGGTALKRGVDLEEVARDEPVVRDEAKFRAALEALGDMVAVPGLDRLPEPERAEVIVRAAGELDDVTAVPHLIAVLSEGHGELQEPACRALSRLWKHSIPGLARANRELKYPVSELPLRALRSITDPRAAPALARLASETASGYVRRAARAAILKMGPGAAGALAPQVRERWAADALVRLGPDSVEHVVPLLSGERRTASKAAGVLLKIGPPAVPALVQVMRTGDRQARGFATSTLRCIEEAEEQLVSLLDDPDPEIRRAAAGALTRAKSPATVEALIRATGDPVSQVRSQAASTLGDLKAERAVRSLAELLGDPDRNVKNAAASALAEIGEKALDVLLEEMRSPDEGRRARAVYCLGLADWAPLEEIAEAFSDPSPRVRRAAASAAGRSRDPWVLRHLLKALKDPDEVVQICAARSLARNFADDTRVIRRMFSDGDEKVRKIAAETVFVKLTRSSVYRPPVELLETALKDESVQVRRPAARALAGIREKEGLVLVLKALSDPDRRVRERAVMSPLLSEPDARPVLVRCLNDESGIVRMRASSFLSRAPPPDTLEIFLKQLRSDPDRRIRCGAAEALGRFGGARASEALGLLRDALERETDERVRRAIQKAIGAQEARVESRERSR